MAKLLKKVLYLYDVDKNIWFWYRHDQDLFYAFDQMSEEQFALPTFVQRTAIVGVMNIYDYPDALLELQETFKRSLKISSYYKSSFETRKLRAKDDVFFHTSNQTESKLSRELFEMSAPAV